MGILPMLIVVVPGADCVARNKLTSESLLPLILAVLLERRTGEGGGESEQAWLLRLLAEAAWPLTLMLCSAQKADRASCPGLDTAPAACARCFWVKSSRLCGLVKLLLLRET